MSSPCNGRKGRGAESRRERGEKPVPVRGAKRAPVGGILRKPLQFDLWPGGSQSEQENAVHYAFQVRGEPHAHVGEAAFGEARQQSEQEQEYAVPHQTAIGV